MFRMLCSARPLVLYGLLFNFGLANYIYADTPSTPTAIDPSKPKSWEGAIDKLNDGVRVATQSLSSVAKDKSRTDEERRQAILLLGKVGSKESLEFLVANVSIRIPVPIILGDEDALRETPCLYALTVNHRGNWNAAKVVFDSLDSQKTKDDLMHLAVVLRRILGPNLSQRIVEDELTKGPKPERRKNLESIRESLKK